MKAGRVVDWEQTVLPSWRRAATSSRHANSDIWSRLPAGVCWLEGELQQEDVARLHVVGSQDWFDVFGSYQLQAISARYQQDLAEAVRIEHSADDAYHHHRKIDNLLYSLQKDCTNLSPLIMVTDNLQGPLILLDGNHRALALLQLGQLCGQRCYVGLHLQMGSDFLWMRRVLQQK